MSHADKITLDELRLIPYVILLMKYGVDDREYRYVNIQDLANELNTTVQNVHKILTKLNREGLVEFGSHKSHIKFSKRGAELCRKVINIVEKYLTPIIRLVGYVTSGLGEGRYYMSIPEYRTQFIQKLGFDPYPGTLNVILKPEYVRNRLLLSKLPGIIIEGFEKNGRKFGSVKCFRAIINGRHDIPCALLIIEKTHHGPEVVELISSHKLRDVLNLKDGDEVVIDVVL